MALGRVEVPDRVGDDVVVLDVDDVPVVWVGLVDGLVGLVWVEIPDRVGDDVVVRVGDDVVVLVVDAEVVRVGLVAVPVLRVGVVVLSAVCPDVLLVGLVVRVTGVRRLVEPDFVVVPDVFRVTDLLSPVYLDVEDVRVAELADDALVVPLLEEVTALVL